MLKTFFFSPCFTLTLGEAIFIRHQLHVMLTVVKIYCKHMLQKKIWVLFDQIVGSLVLLFELESSRFINPIMAFLISFLVILK